MGKRCCKAHWAILTVISAFLIASFPPVLEAGSTDPCSGSTKGFWPMSEGTGNIIHDVCNGLDGTIIQGVTWGSDVEGSFLEFTSGDGPRVEINEPILSQNTSTTVELRIQRETVDDRFIAQMLQPDGSRGSRRWILGTRGLQVWGETGSGTIPEGGFTDNELPTIYNSNGWTHVAFQIDGNQVWLYYDGVLRASGTLPFPQQLRNLSAITEFGSGERIFGFGGKIQFVRISSGIRNDFLVTRPSENEPPTANDDHFTTDEDAPLNVPAPGVLGNDSDVDDDPLAVNLLTNPNNGTLAQNADGSFTYTPSPNFNGNDSYTYEACDPEGLCDSATVNITVDPVNDAPEIVINNPQVTVDEGDLATNNGLVSDVDGDNVTVTASVGAVSQSNSGWSWSLQTTDGPGDSQMVTITADDGNSGLTSADFDLIVTNLAPTVNAVTNSGPISEGGSATITVNASDPAGANDPLSYAFDCNNDNTFEIGPQPGNSASCPFGDNGTFTVNVRISDDDGGVATGSTQVIVENVAPMVDAGADTTITRGDTFMLTATFTDPGTVDTHTATIDWGDGTSAPGQVGEDTDTVSGSHEYTILNTYRVEVCVTDKDGAQGCDDLQLEVVGGRPSDPGPPDDPGKPSGVPPTSPPGGGKP